MPPLTLAVKGFDNLVAELAINNETNILMGKVYVHYSLVAFVAVADMKEITRKVRGMERAK